MEYNLQDFRNKHKTTLETLRQMQLDCYKMTDLMFEIKFILNITMTDEEMLEWIGPDGPFKFLDELQYKATGVRMKNTDLTKEHMKVLAGMGIGEVTFDRLLKGLDTISKIDYFEPAVVDGRVVIDSCEFDGSGVTGFLCYALLTNEIN